MIWRRDKSFAERENMQHRGSSDSRHQERRRILIAQPKEVAMRWKCPGSVAEMFFIYNLAREVAGEGQTSRYFCTRLDDHR